MGPHGPGGRFHGRRAQEPPAIDVGEVRGWLAGRIPDNWFTAPPEVVIDREEITVTGTLVPPTDSDELDGRAAERGRIQRFREDTREARIEIARELEARYLRHVAWAARAGETLQVFTSAAVPAMTRLRQPERQVLDTLVEAGVARSRADALAWCVRLVGEHQDEWITSLREALDNVDQVRREGPR